MKTGRIYEVDVYTILDKEIFFHTARHNGIECVDHGLQRGLVRRITCRGHRSNLHTLMLDMPKELYFRRGTQWLSESQEFDFQQFAESV